MRSYLVAVVALMLGSAPAIGDSHVRYVVHGATNSLATHQEVSGPAKTVNLRLFAPPSHQMHLHPRMQPPVVRSSRFDKVPPPPALRVEVLSQSHTDDEPGAFNSVSTSLYKSLPSADTASGIHIITTPQLIKSADGRLLGMGVTGRF